MANDDDKKERGGEGWWGREIDGDVEWQTTGIIDLGDDGDDDEEPAAGSSFVDDDKAMYTYREFVADEINEDRTAPFEDGAAPSSKLPPGWAKYEGGKADSSRPQPEDVVSIDQLPAPPEIEPPLHTVMELEAPYTTSRLYLPITITDTLFENQLRDTMWPQKGFLKTYVDWMTASTDAPKAFHLAAGLVTLATAIGDHIRLESRRAEGLGANMFFLLIGESGLRKSTTFEPIEELLSCSHRRLTGYQKSDLALFDSVAKANNVPQSWIVDEAAGLLGMVQGKYGREIQEQLNKLYDGRELTYTSFTQKGTLRTSGFVSLITASPLAWLRECRLTNEFLQGGVFARFVVIPAVRGKKDEIKPLPSAPDPQIRSALVDWLDALTKMTGSVRVGLTHEAEQELLAWLLKRGEVPEAAHGIWNRADTVVRKIALLYHIAQGFGQRPISGETMEMAIKFVHYFILPGHVWATMRLPEIPPFARVMQGIEEKTAFSPAGLEYSYLSYTFNATQKTIVEVLWALYQANKIVFYGWRQGRGRPLILVGAPNKLPVREGAVTILDKLPAQLEQFGKLLGEIPEGLQPSGPGTESECDDVLEDAVGDPTEVE